MTKFEKGKIIRGTVTSITSYGAFVSCDEYYTGLIHISEISNRYVKDVNNFFKIGDVISVEVLDVDEELGHLRLSIKNINKNHSYKKRRIKIVETKSGFNTLKHYLPIWMEQSLRKIKK